MYMKRLGQVLDTLQVGGVQGALRRVRSVVWGGGRGGRRGSQGLSVMFIQGLCLVHERLGQAFDTLQVGGTYATLPPSPPPHEGRGSRGSAT
jgi:hypothetical protein